MSRLFSDSGMYSILNAMHRTQMAQKTAALRMSTSFRINSAVDDPAGLVAISLLGSELGSAQAASENGSRANAMMDVADGAMDQISTLVSDIRSLTTSLANSSGLSEDEKAAKQLEIDSAVASIDRLVGSTTFNGKQLLNGNLGITTAGVDTTKITDVDITGRSVAQNTSITLNVTTAAQRGQVSWTGISLAWGNNVTMEVTGNLGTMQLSFGGGTTAAQMAATINANTDATGVRASASGGKVYFQSQNYGDNEYVSVQTLSGTFNLDGGTTTDLGADANVTVNGQTATVDGMNVSFNVAGTSGSAVMSQSFMRTAGSTETFTVTGGGATFSLTPNAADLMNIGIGNLGSAHLGNATLGYLHDLTTGGASCARDNAGQASQIAQAAVTQVARARANVGAFQKYTVGSIQNSLAEAETSLSSAIGQIKDADYAVEVANMTRLNTLFQAQLSALSIMGQHSSSVMGLLSGLN